MRYCTLKRDKKNIFSSFVDLCVSLKLDVVERKNLCIVNLDTFLSEVYSEKQIAIGVIKKILVSFYAKKMFKHFNYVAFLFEKSYCAILLSLTFHHFLSYLIALLC